MVPEISDASFHRSSVRKGGYPQEESGSRCFGGAPSGWTGDTAEPELGVTGMQGFEEIEEKFARAEGLADKLAAGREAFQFIVLVADHYSALASEQFAMWMFAISSACEGRDYLGLSPSVRRDPAAYVEIPNLRAVDEDDGADGLAAIAGMLAKRLRELADTVPVPQTPGHAPRQRRPR